MGLTGTEFELITRGIAPASRRMLIKQGSASVVAELNLDGFDDELAILSGRTDVVDDVIVLPYGAIYHIRFTAQQEVDRPLGFGRTR